MRTHKHKIPEHVKDILNRATIDGNALKITEQLERADYVAVNKVVELAGGKWNRKAQAHVFPSDPRVILELAVESGSIVDEKKTFNFFPTPMRTADAMVREAQIEPGHRVLEPSAGKGSICEAICRSRIGGMIHLTAIEVNEKFRDLLETVASAVDCVDFMTLKMEGAPTYDRILMNPPFDRGDDIKHILHALTFLKPGGRLVAICGDGPRQMEKLQPLADSWIELPVGTFKDTQIRTVKLTINKGME